MKKIVFIVSSALALLLTLEGIVRAGLYLLPREAREAFYAREGLIAGPLFYETLEDGTRMNRLGFLGPEFALEKPPDTFRLLMIGGSAVRRGLSEALRRELAGACPRSRCEVIDGGVPGAVSAHELYNLARWLSYDPDLVIVYDGWNDVYFSRYVPEQYAPETEALRRRLARLRKPNYWLIRHSRLVQAARAMRRNLTSFFEPAVAWASPSTTFTVNWIRGSTVFTVLPHAPIADRFSQTYFRNLVEMGLELRRRRVPALFILQPSLTFASIRRGLSPAERLVSEQVAPELRNDWVYAVGILYPRAQAAQVAARNRHGYPFLDFSDLFTGRPKPLFEDLVHMTPEGNRWVASQIVRVCRSRNLLADTRE